MKNIFKMIGALSIILTLVLAAGCTSPDGQRLTKAIIKSAEVESMESASDVSMKLDLKGVDITSENQMVIDLLNSLTLSSVTKSDLKKNNSVSNASLKMGFINLIEGKLYSDGQKAWFVVPGNPRAIELSADEEEKGLSQAQMLQLQTELRTQVLDFLKDYVGEYKYVFNSLKNKGTQTVDTPEGQKQVTNIEVKISNAEFSKIIEYTLKNASSSNALKGFLKSMISLGSEIDSSEDSAKVEEEINQGFEELKGASDQEIKDAVDELMSFIEIGKGGIVLNYGIDSDNNIVKNDSYIDLVVKDPDDISQRIGFVINSKSTNYNINKTKVDLPKFNKENTIGFKDYVKGNPMLKDSPIGEALGVQKKTILLGIGRTNAVANGREVELDSAPYIEEGSTMVPVRFIGESLDADVEWDDFRKEVTYNDGEREIVMQVGNKTAIVGGRPVYMPVAPIIRNGRTMVPVRFISENFGAQVEWNESLQSVEIYKD